MSCGTGSVGVESMSTKSARRCANSPGHGIGNEVRVLEDPNPSGLCMCGCGEPTDLARKSYARLGWVKDKPKRYVNGHNQRGIPRPATIHAGERFGRLVVLRESKREDRHRFYACRCDCGAEHEVNSRNLRGNVRSCGCLARESASALLLTHGGSGTSAHSSWRAMRGRCLSPSAGNFDLYGGRGILPCDGIADFEHFLSVMGSRPEGMSLDRIDVDGGYWCGDCDDCRAHGRSKNMRWANATTQANNRRPRRKA